MGYVIYKAGRGSAGNFSVNRQEIFFVCNKKISSRYGNAGKCRKPAEGVIIVMTVWFCLFFFNFFSCLCGWVVIFVLKRGLRGEIWTVDVGCVHVVDVIIITFNGLAACSCCYLLHLIGLDLIGLLVRLDYHRLGYIWFDLIRFDSIWFDLIWFDWWLDWIITG